MMYGNMVNFYHFMSSIFQYVLMYVLITAIFVVIFFFLARNVFSNICTLIVCNIVVLAFVLASWYVYQVLGYPRGKIGEDTGYRTITV